MIAREFWEIVALAGRAAADGREEAAAILLSSVTQFAGLRGRRNDEPIDEYTLKPDAEVVSLISRAGDQLAEACRQRREMKK